ncbi:MAG: FCD domain-containing protein [Rhodospirillales bacterium]|nr:FCD domain-containing protein [Rhodospirillales bacterium]
MSDLIQRRKFYREIADRLILSGQFRVAPMERFGAGRPAVRAAWLSLERTGLIAVSGGERSRVVRPSAASMDASRDAAVGHWLNEHASMRYLQDARDLLEAGLARQAAAAAGPAGIERLRQALARNRGALACLPDFKRSDMAFHFVIVEIARNPIFTAVPRSTDTRASSTWCMRTPPRPCVTNRAAGASTYWCRSRSATLTA